MAKVANFWDTGEGGHVSASTSLTVTLPIMAPEPHTFSRADELSVRHWLACIGETDPDTIAAVLARCEHDRDAAACFIGRAATAQLQAPHYVTCATCEHFDRLRGHPRLGQCLQRHRFAIGGAWDIDRRVCGDHTPAPERTTR